MSTANLDPEQLPAFNGDPIGDSFDFHNDALFSVPSIALSNLLGWLAKKYAFEPDLETVCSVVGTQLDVGLVAIIMRDLRDPRLNSTAVVAVWERASDKQFANRLSSIETDQWSELFSVSRSPTRQITSPVGQASPTMLNVAEALQQQLLRTGLTQPLAKPIIVQGQLSGFAIFDQIRTPHEWTQAQDTTLRFLALQHGIFMERQLERQSVLAIQQTLFRAIRLKSEVTSRLSHELRTPLTGIKGMLDLIGETRLDEFQKQLMEMAQESTDRLTNMVSKLVDVPYDVNAQMGESSVEFSLARLGEALQTRMSNYRQSPAMALRVDLDAALPMRIRFDRDLLEQVLFRLGKYALSLATEAPVVLAIQPLGMAEGSMRLRFDLSYAGATLEQERREFSPQGLPGPNADILFELDTASRLLELMGHSLELIDLDPQHHTLGFTLRVENAGVVTHTAQVSPQTDQDQDNLAIALISDQVTLTNTISTLFIKLHQTLQSFTTADDLCSTNEKQFNLIIYQTDDPTVDVASVRSKLVPTGKLIRVAELDRLGTGPLGMFDMQFPLVVFSERAGQILHDLGRESRPSVQQPLPNQTDDQFRILVIDDNETNFALLERGLGKMAINSFMQKMPIKG